MAGIAAALSAVGQFYRVSEIRHLRRLVRQLDIDCIFDVGANTGQYASMLRRWVGFRGDIISFEPNPMVAETLNKNCAGDRRWRHEAVALSHTTGTVSFNLTNDTQFGSVEQPNLDETSALRQNLQVKRVIAVTSETLDDAFDRLSSDIGFARPMLKMDTQGHDLSVFRSGPKNAKKFVALQSELSFIPFYEQVPLYHESIQEYQDAGFQLNSIFQNNRGHFPYLREMDCIMVNRDIVT